MFKTSNSQIDSFYDYVSEKIILILTKLGNEKKIIKPK